MKKKQKALKNNAKLVDAPELGNRLSFPLKSQFLDGQNRVSP